MSARAWPSENSDGFIFNPAFLLAVGRPPRRAESLRLVISRDSRQTRGPEARRMLGCKG